MKEKTTKKWIKSMYGTPIIIRKEKFNNLMQFIEADYYSTRAEGWACDYKYMVSIDKIVCWGYAPIGRMIKDYSIVDYYEELAKKEIQNYNDRIGIYAINENVSDDMSYYEYVKINAILKDKLYKLFEECINKVELK